jgi:hypothetical protein
MRARSLHQDQASQLQGVDGRVKMLDHIRTLLNSLMRRYRLFKPYQRFSHLPVHLVNDADWYVPSRPDQPDGCR